MKLKFKREESIGAVIACFRLAALVANPDMKTVDKQFLLLKGSNGDWNFPKGHRENGETDYDTLRREILEETGIAAYRIIGYVDKIRYSFVNNNGHYIEKCVKFYYVVTDTHNITLSNEHVDYAWRVYNQARTLLTFNKSKFILDKVNMHR